MMDVGRQPGLFLERLPFVGQMFMEFDGRVIADLWFGKVIVFHIQFIAPNISLGFIFSLKSSMENGIINTGTIDMMVLAIPVAVFWTAKSEKYTPRNGPKNAPINVYLNADLFWHVRVILFHAFR